jgi:hypothetical protein
MRIIILASLLLASPAVADDLDDAYNACIPHKEPVDPRNSASVRSPPFKPPWDHCLVIYRSWLQRDAAERESDEARNPALKKSRDMAKKLTAPALPNDAPNPTEVK